MKSKAYFIDDFVDEQYQLFVNSSIAKVNYIKTVSKVYITSVEVPGELKTQGFDYILLQCALTDIDKQNLQLETFSNDVTDYIKMHPEWNHLYYSQVI